MNCDKVQDVLSHDRPVYCRSCGVEIPVEDDLRDPSNQPSEGTLDELELGGVNILNELERLKSENEALKERLADCGCDLCGDPRDPEEGACRGCHTLFITQYGKFKAENEALRKAVAEMREFLVGEMPGACSPIDDPPMEWVHQCEDVANRVEKLDALFNPLTRGEGGDE
ncbi:MAG: hypothetical protein JKY61_13015 [Planctomycetes bacterium]|nr:hypothetical protein [Planctomycetota bacterium]